MVDQQVRAVRTRLLCTGVAWGGGPAKPCNRLRETWRGRECVCAGLTLRAAFEVVLRVNFMRCVGLRGAAAVSTLGGNVCEGVPGVMAGCTWGAARRDPPLLVPIPSAVSCGRESHGLLDTVSCVGWPKRPLHGDCEGHMACQSLAVAAVEMARACGGGGGAPCSMDPMQSRLVQAPQHAVGQLGWAVRWLAFGNNTHMQSTARHPAI